MFLRATNRKKDGKDHRYFSVVENQRISSSKTVQRTLLYLGEINDQQEASWRKTLSVFDEDKQDYTNLSLFPDDRSLPDDAIDSILGYLGTVPERPALLHAVKDEINTVRIFLLHTAQSGQHVVLLSTSLPAQSMGLL